MFESASGCWDGARVGAARDGEALSTCRLMLLDTLLQHLHLAPTPACGHLHLAPCTLHQLHHPLSLEGCNSNARTAR